jgi:hypothetical protein
MPMMVRLDVARGARVGNAAQGWIVAAHKEVSAADPSSAVGEVMRAFTVAAHEHGAG